MRDVRTATVFFVQNNDGQLATVIYTTDRGRFGSGVYPSSLSAGTSPAVIADSSVQPEMAFQGSNGHLWTLDAFTHHAAVDTALPMKTGTSPIVVPLALG
jgi:hypothetical protein